MNTTDPKAFAAEAIAAIQRQLDAGHKLVTDRWVVETAKRVACSGCALTLVAFDSCGADAVIDAMTARADDGLIDDGEDVIGAMLGMDPTTCLQFAEGFDNGHVRHDWEGAGTTVREHFQSTGALPHDYGCDCGETPDCVPDNDDDGDVSDSDDEGEDS